VSESFKKFVKGVGEMIVGDWRKKQAKIGNWSAGVLTPNDHLKNRITMRESNY